MVDYKKYEVTDGDHKTDLKIIRKTVVINTVPARAITLTIGVFFDGTGNNTNNTNQRLLQDCTAEDVGMNSADAQSCMRKLKMGSIGAGSYLNYYTNIHWLSTLYIQDEDLSDDKEIFQGSVYVSGIGTSAGKPDSAIGKGIGAWVEGVVDKTDEAVNSITAEIKRFLGVIKNQNILIKKVQFDVFGFSRGAAAARHFSNRVLSQDKAITAAINKGLETASRYGKSAGEVRFLGIFDTVAAVGGLKNMFNVHGGGNPGIDLALPVGVAEHVFQITAMHECRYNFSLNSIKEAWPELSLPGVHSDVGGGYNPQEREYIFLTRPKFETVYEGVTERDTQVFRQTENMIPTLRITPEIAPIVANSTIRTETWYDYNTTPGQKRAGVIQKRVGAAVTAERVITNDWAKVCMRVMLDAAKDSGVLFEEIQEKDKNLSVPLELEPLIDKAIAQGKAIRCGKKIIPFTQEEMNLIGKYIHCSANWNAVIVKDVWLDGKEVKVIRGAVRATEITGFVDRPNPSWKRTVWNMRGEEV
ncbi:putative alpha/beta hydrolase family protein DUF2235 [Serratia fonticola]|uniref:Putative alpha/beta hydrolase family protein DUF2235 n=1 Tax=Serratia fonticola TaxID=47917 RepID=A0A542D129_SERFO|nr:DUF2235 domain-containing protein [Serratia fonticola]TQI81192.1 putative alpha/beta hydrolase family protein DUF2235 [Serratia fonticola]TQI96784.1 putative alpha/beta hydrolase family protein DUF2235 [Serratia fonticola]TVZ71280.1 putative alpha/beta hydrolase family protein DUF2235 [Serratia fonticola]